MKKLWYISVLYLLVLQSMQAQTPPWTVVPTSSSQEIVIQKLDSTIAYDASFTGNNGDVIAAFYDQGGTPVCAGMYVVDGVTSSFLVYGNDAVDNGYQNFEFYSFKYWRKAQNCVVDGAFINITMSNAQYFPGGSDTLYIFAAFPGVAEYPSDYYCKNNIAALPIPFQVTNTTYSNLSISITPAGFNGINLANGDIIDYNTILNGTYTFTMSTLDNSCLRDSTFNLTIGNRLYIAPPINITASACNSSNGTISLDTALIPNGTYPYLLKLKSLATNITISNPLGLFQNLEVGSYELIIEDLDLCADTFTVVVPSGCDADVPDIITPTLNVNFAQAYLPWEGVTKIYNNQGHLITTLNTPGVWDGKDKFGNQVSTGAYFLFTNGRKKKEITVVE